MKMDNQRHNNLQEKKIDSEEKYNGRLLHVFSDSVELPDGSRSYREYLRHYGAVCVVPLTDEGNVIMEYQYRYPVSRVILEIPAGKLDSESEDPESAAKRELLEETGFTADEWINIGEYMPAPAYSNEHVTMFIARGLHKGDRHLDDGEFLDVVEIPMDDMIKMIIDGSIEDGKTQSAILKTHMLLQNM